MTQRPTCIASDFEANAGLRRVLRVLFGIALLAGILLRLVGISSPPFDSNNFRQVDTLSTIEAFYSHGIDLLHPRTLYLGYPGICVMEFPLFQALVAVLYHVFGPHLEVIRTLNILFGIGTVWLLYRAAAHFLDRMTAILAATIYWLAPLNIIYQRSMLYDPGVVFCGMLSFYCLARLLFRVGPAPTVEKTRADCLLFAAFTVATWLVAMMKVLYLWPVVLLVAAAFLVNGFKFGRQMPRILGVLALAGLSFLGWNAYAAHIDGASALSRDLAPTSHLGFASLFQADYYYTQFFRRPAWWLSAMGALLYPIGLMACWRQRHERGRAGILYLAMLIPPTYLLVFPDMNYPHDYYQLIITPFLAIISANGLRWLMGRLKASPTESRFLPRIELALGGALLILAAILTYRVWLKAPHVDAQVAKFQEICARRFGKETPAILFVARNVAAGPGSVNGTDAPPYLYAAGLWGAGAIVDNAAAAQSVFHELAPALHKLDFVIFYGTDRPEWLPSERFQLLFQEDNHHLYAFKFIAPL